MGQKPCEKLLRIRPGISHCRWLKDDLQGKSFQGAKLNIKLPSSESLGQFTKQLDLDCDNFLTKENNIREFFKFTYQLWLFYAVMASCLFFWC